MTEPINTLVSVIMPAYNAEHTIVSSIDSVILQSYRNWELIVVNDGSTDDTLKLLTTKSATDDRIRILHLPRNGGLPNARNQGILLARGELIAFLDSDDRWHPDKLALQVDFHRTHPEVRISHTAYEFFNDNGVVKRRLSSLTNPKSGKEGNLYPSVCYGNPIGVLTVIAAKDVIVSAGMFDASLHTLEDQDLWIRIAKQGAKFGYLTRILASYRLSSSGITSKTGKYKLAYKTFIRKVQANNNVDINLLWRPYYRYFGTVYFKRGEYALSRIYLCKSFRLKPFDAVSLTTLVYIVYNMSKHILKPRRAA